VKWISSDGHWIVEFVRLSAAGHGRDWDRLRVTHHGYLVGEARDWDEVDKLGVDVADLRGRAAGCS